MHFYWIHVTVLWDENLSNSSSYCIQSNLEKRITIKFIRWICIQYCKSNAQLFVSKWLLKIIYEMALAYKVTPQKFYFKNKNIISLNHRITDTLDYTISSTSLFWIPHKGSLRRRKFFDKRSLITMKIKYCLAYFRCGINMGKVYRFEWIYMSNMTQYGGSFFTFPTFYVSASFKLVVFGIFRK